MSGPRDALEAVLLREARTGREVDPKHVDGDTAARHCGVQCDIVKWTPQLAAKCTPLASFDVDLSDCVNSVTPGNSVTPSDSSSSGLTCTLSLHVHTALPKKPSFVNVSALPDPLGSALLWFPAYLVLRFHSPSTSSQSPSHVPLTRALLEAALRALPRSVIADAQLSRTVMFDCASSFCDAAAEEGMPDVPAACEDVITIKDILDDVDIEPDEDSDTEVDDTVSLSQRGADSDEEVATDCD